MTEVRPRPSVISSGAKQNREIPLHYAACLYCQERYSPHFCLIVCHLTPDSLKSPQISNPPLVLRTTFPPQASGTIKVPQTSNLKPQTSNLKSQISNLKSQISILPALRSLPLLSGKAILLHFCLIFCHLISIVYIFSSNFWRLTSLNPQISDPLGTSYRLSLKRGACHWIFSCCYLTISPLSNTISVPIPSCRRWYKKVDFPLIHGTMMSEERGIMFNKKETRRIESL